MSAPMALYVQHIQRVLINALDLNANVTLDFTNKKLSLLLDLKIMVPDLVTTFRYQALNVFQIVIKTNVIRNRVQQNLNV